MSKELTTEQEIIVPFESSTTKKYEAGEIERSYRTETWVKNPESIPVIVTYHDQSPIYVTGGGGDRRYDSSRRQQTVSFGSPVTHQPFFSNHEVYGAWFHLFTKRDGSQIRKMTTRFGPEPGNLLDRANDGNEFDATTWEEDIQALFDRLPLEVRDVVGL